MRFGLGWQSKLSIKLEPDPFCWLGSKCQCNPLKRIKEAQVWVGGFLAKMLARLVKLSLNVTYKLQTVSRPVVLVGLKKPTQTSYGKFKLAGGRKSANPTFNILNDLLKTFYRRSKIIISSLRNCQHPLSLVIADFPFLVRSYRFNPMEWQMVTVEQCASFALLQVQPSCL